MMQTSPSETFHKKSFQSPTLNHEVKKTIVYKNNQNPHKNNLTSYIDYNPNTRSEKHVLNTPKPTTEKNVVHSTRYYDKNVRLDIIPQPRTETHTTAPIVQNTEQRLVKQRPNLLKNIFLPSKEIIDQKRTNNTFLTQNSPQSTSSFNSKIVRYSPKEGESISMTGAMSTNNILKKSIYEDNSLTSNNQQ